MIAEAGSLGTDLREELKRLVQKSALHGEFTLSSGEKSDFYLDCRQVTLSAYGAFLIGTLFAEQIWQMGGEAIGGPTLGADPIVGAVISTSGGGGNPIQGFLVRKEPKSHGTGKWIEGPKLPPKTRVVIVEDVVTSGKSAIEAVERVRAETDWEILGILCLVDREEKGVEKIETACNLPVRSLFKKSEL